MLKVLKCFGGGVTRENSQTTTSHSPRAAASVPSATNAEETVAPSKPQQPALRAQLAAAAETSPVGKDGQRHHRNRQSRHGSSKSKRAKQFDLPAPTMTPATDPTIGDGDKLAGLNVLTGRPKMPSNHPDFLQGLRATTTLRTLQIHGTPEELLWDIDDLTLIRVGKRSLVMHGVWQGTEVALKFVTTKFNFGEPGIREAMLGIELSHPNLVRMFAVRITSLMAPFMAEHAYTDETRTDAEHRMASTASAQLPKSLFRTSFDSDEGFGPPPSTYRVEELANLSQPDTPSYWNKEYLAAWAAETSTTNTTTNNNNTPQATTNTEPTSTSSPNPIISTNTTQPASSLPENPAPATTPSPATVISSPAPEPTTAHSAAGTTSSAGTATKSIEGASETATARAAHPSLGGASEDVSGTYLTTADITVQLVNTPSKQTTTAAPSTTSLPSESTPQSVSPPSQSAPAPSTSQPATTIPAGTSATTIFAAAPGTTGPSGAGPSRAKAASSTRLQEQSPDKRNWRRPEIHGRRRAKSPWTHGITWSHVMSLLNAQSGRVLLMSICEYCELGTLSEAIHIKKIFRAVPMRAYNEACVPLRALIRTACDMTVALHHLHKIGVIHGDFKTSSLLLTGSRADRRGYKVKLSNYGSAHLINTNPPPALRPHSLNAQSIMRLRPHERGTIPYVAPETLAGFLSKESDVYSLGVVLWEMCHSQIPFSQYSEAEFIDGMLIGHLQLTCDAAVPQRLTDLINRCLQRSPAKRPGTAEILCILNKIEADLREEIYQIRMQHKTSSNVPGALRLSTLSSNINGPSQAASGTSTGGNSGYAGVQTLTSTTNTTNTTTTNTNTTGLAGRIQSQPSVPEQDLQLMQQLHEQLLQQQQHLAQLAVSVAQPQPQPQPQPQQAQVAWQQQAMPPPRNHWPQLPPLVLAPKQVTMQNQPKAPEQNVLVPNTDEHHTAILAASRSLAQHLRARPDATLNITPQGIEDLIDRGRYIAMEKAREEVRNRRQTGQTSGSAVGQAMPSSESVAEQTAQTSGSVAVRLGDDVVPSSRAAVHGEEMVAPSSTGVEHGVGVQHSTDLSSSNFGVTFSGR